MSVDFEFVIMFEIFVGLDEIAITFYLQMGALRSSVAHKLQYASVELFSNLLSE